MRYRFAEGYHFGMAPMNGVTETPRGRCSMATAVAVETVVDGETEEGELIDSSWHVRCS